MTRKPKKPTSAFDWRNQPSLIDWSTKHRRTPLVEHLQLAPAERAKHVEAFQAGYSHNFVVPK